MLELKIIMDNKPSHNKEKGEEEEKKKAIKRWEFILLGGTVFSIALWLFIVTGCLIIIADPLLKVLLGTLAVAWLQFVSVSMCGVLTIILMIGLMLLNTDFLPFRPLISVSVFCSFLALIFLTVFDFVLFEMFSVRSLVVSATSPLFQGMVAGLRLITATSLAILFFFLLINILTRVFKLEMNNKGYYTPIISLVTIFSLDAFYWFMFGVSILVPITLGGAP